MRVIILLIIFFYKNLCFFAYADIIETSFLTKEEIITSIDVENRKNLKKKLLSITKEDLLEIPLLFPKPKSDKEQLTKEAIIRIEANKNNINITQEDIIKEINTIFFKYNISYQELRNKEFKDYPYLLQEYENYIKTYLSWIKIVRTSIIPTIILKYSDFKELAEINNIETKSTNVKLYEIYLTSESLKNEALENISDLQDFINFAKKFSQSPTAKNGGLIGWINLSDLKENTAILIDNLKLEDISSVKEDMDGYYLYMIEDKKDINFIDPEIEKIMHKALLEQKLTVYIKKFFIESKRNF